MGISDIFGYHISDGNGTAVTGKTAEAASETSGNAAQAGTAAVNAAPGDIISGKITMSDSGSIQLRLSDDTVLKAQVDDNIRLVPGDNVSFQVKSTDNGLVLTPLGTNTAAGASAEQALRSAQMEVDQDNIQMVTQMMKEGMQIDTSSLQSMGRLTAQFPSVDMTEVIQLKNMDVDVTSDNVSQLKNYKNAQYQIEQSAAEVAEMLTDDLNGLAAAGAGERAAAVYSDLLGLIGRQDGSMDSASGMLTGENAIVPSENRTVSEASQMQAQPAGTDTLSEVQIGSLADDDVLAQAADIAEAEGFPQTAADSIRNGTMSVKDFLSLLGKISGMESMPAENAAESTTVPDTPAYIKGTDASPADGTEKIAADVTDNVKTAAIQAGKDSMTSFQPGIGQTAAHMDEKAVMDLIRNAGKMLENGNSTQQPETDGGRLQPLLRLLQSEPVKKMIQDTLTRQWQLTPADVTDKGSVKQLYERILRQTEEIQNVLSRHDMLQSPSGSAIQNLRSNVDFINQINQTFSYVQLPVKLADGSAHGDLYVYTNKKNLSKGDGTVTALLHLDMAALGPMDVYIAMNRQNHVNTHFYLQDEESLDLIASHIDELDRHLADKGYSMTSELSVRDGMTQAAEEIVAQGRSASKLISYSSFDARA
jgi:hypothetical protein